MSITLRNKATGAIVNTVMTKLSLYPHNLWEIVAQKGIVEVYQNRNGNPLSKIIIGKYEKDVLENVLAKNVEYQFVNLPDFDLAPSRLPIKTPNKNNPAPIIAKIKPTISKTFKNDYFKYTIIGVVVTIISYFAYEYFKYKNW